MRASMKFVLVVLVVGVVVQVLGWTGVLGDTFTAVVTAVCMLLALPFVVRAAWNRGRNL